MLLLLLFFWGERRRGVTNIDQEERAKTELFNVTGPFSFFFFGGMSLICSNSHSWNPAGVHETWKLIVSLTSYVFWTRKFGDMKPTMLYECLTVDLRVCLLPVWQRLKLSVPRASSQQVVWTASIDVHQELNLPLLFYNLSTSCSKIRQRLQSASFSLSSSSKN